NAIKFTDKGHIRVSAHHEADRVCFAVEDTGIGIAREELDRMQRPYEQGHDSSLDGRGGFGPDEAVRVVESSPKWTPGKQRGKAVRTTFTFPISFKL
ncbi:MAG: ATP-binding protein, partial [Perlabentimonas sp.]